MQRRIEETRKASRASVIWFNSKIYNWGVALIGLVYLTIITTFTSQTIELSAARIGDPFLFVTTSMAGWIILKTVADLLVLRGGRMKSAFVFLGKHTLPILCLHVISFKLISRVYIWSHHIPSYYLASFHVIFLASGWWKLLYTMAGICLPLIFYWLYCELFK